LKETYLKRCFTVKKKNKTLFDAFQNLQMTNAEKTINKLMQSGKTCRQYRFSPFCLRVNGDVSVWLQIQFRSKHRFKQEPTKINAVSFYSIWF
jgi:hypothetical protein